MSKPKLVVNFDPPGGQRVLFPIPCDGAPVYSVINATAMSASAPAPWAWPCSWPVGWCWTRVRRGCGVGRDHRPRGHR